MKTQFLGFSLKGSIIAASCPATESIEGISACANNGAAAVILKTGTSHKISGEDSNGGRHCYIDAMGFWAKSTFNREIMSIKESEELLKHIPGSVEVPVIASVTELELDAEKWIDDCAAMEQAGAAAIQLDLFYIKNLLSVPDFEHKFVNLLKEIISHCHIPVMPKLNIGLPAEYAVYLLKKAGIRFVSLLDSIASPAPLCFDEKGGAFRDASFQGPGLSLFGSFMLPMTRMYTQTLSSAGFEVCAGGGIQTAENIVDCLLLGASTIQIATEVLLKGYSRFEKLETESNVLLSRMGVKNTRSLQEKIQSVYSHGHARGRALYNPQHCTRCGICINQTFCRHISKDRDGYVTIENCEGCGLCVSLCGSGAIKLV